MKGQLSDPNLWLASLWNFSKAFILSRHGSSHMRTRRRKYSDFLFLLHACLTAEKPCRHYHLLSLRLSHGLSLVKNFFFCVLYKLTVFFALTFRITHDCITDIQQLHKHRGPHPSISIPVPTPIIAST